MILPSTVIITMDNSGARRVRCIKIYKKPGRKSAQTGDLIQIIVVKLRNRGFIRVKKGELHTAVVSRISSTVFRKKKGYFIKFDANSVIILSKKKMPIGTRFFGPCAREIRNHKFVKLISISTKLI